MATRFKVSREKNRIHPLQQRALVLAHMQKCSHRLFRLPWHLGILASWRKISCQRRFTHLPANANSLVKKRERLRLLTVKSPIKKHIQTPTLSPHEPAHTPPKRSHLSRVPTAHSPALLRHRQTHVGTEGTFMWLMEEIGELATALHKSKGQGGQHQRKRRPPPENSPTSWHGSAPWPTSTASTSTKPYATNI